MVQEEGELIIHGMERFKWVHQMRASDIVVVAVSI